MTEPRRLQVAETIRSKMQRERSELEEVEKRLGGRDPEISDLIEVVRSLTALVKSLHQRLDE